MLSSAGAFVLATLTFVYGEDLKNPQSFIDSLKFSDKNFEDAFKGLNVNARDKKITPEDLNILFYHGEANFAKEKFLEMVDTNLNGVSIQELARFMIKDPVKLAIHECIYVKSDALRRLCFADQILTYVYLVLDHNTADVLFSALESNLKDRKLDLSEIKKLKRYNDKFNDNAAEYFHLEIGRGETTIDPKTFQDYILREDFNDNFRGCKNDPTKTEKYDKDCLFRALMNYIMFDVTEHMTVLVFSFLNQKVYDSVLDKRDMELAFGNDRKTRETIERFYEILDLTRDGVISYGEFRAYVKSHSVKLHLERACLRQATVQPWQKNRDCLKGALWDLIEKNHRPMLMSVPDLDMLFLFEELDKTNDGKIYADRDLVEKLKWKSDKANKFISEIDAPNIGGSTQKGFVTLDGFFYYVYEPNMVYGLGGCLTQPVGNTRMLCYVKELDKIITSILTKTQVITFHRFYRNEPITRKELEAVGMREKNEIDNFLSEIGMGDESITKWEFTWFVKQQELSEMFKPDMRNDPKRLHGELLSYLKNTMTEYDIQELFRRLDKNNNFELDRDDFKNVNDAKMIENINFLDQSGKVSFLEFWLFLHTPSKFGDKQLRKRKLEEDCTTQYSLQKDELDCYELKIKEVI